MAWLEGLAAKHGAKPEELVTDPNARTEVAPEWVDKAKEINEQAPAPEDHRASDADDITGIWLRNLEEEESEISHTQAYRTRDSPIGGAGFKDQNDLGDHELIKAKKSCQSWMRSARRIG